MPIESEAVDTLSGALQNSFLPNFFEQYTIYFIIGLFLVFMRESVQNAFAGASVFFGSKYDENMVCFITVGGKRRPARISKTSLLSTTFYIYRISDQKIQGGTLLSVPNSELKHLMLERPLDNLDLSEVG